MINNIEDLHLSSPEIYNAINSATHGYLDHLDGLLVEAFKISIDDNYDNYP